MVNNSRLIEATMQGAKRIKGRGAKKAIKVKSIVVGGKPRLKSYEKGIYKSG